MQFFASGILDDQEPNAIKKKFKNYGKELLNPFYDFIRTNIDTFFQKSKNFEFNHKAVNS